MNSSDTNPNKKKNHIIPSVLAAIITVVAAVVIATYMISVLVVTGSDMSPSLNKGDIVVMLNSAKYESGDVCCMYSRNRMLLKRVVALSGSSVEIDNAGNVFSDGKLMDSIQQVDKASLQTDISFPYKVPDETLFVMSDNGNKSLNDENLVSGNIEKRQLAGKVVLKIWPLSDFGFID